MRSSYEPQYSHVVPWSRALAGVINQIHVFNGGGGGGGWCTRSKPSKAWGAHASSTQKGPELARDLNRGPFLLLGNSAKDLGGCKIRLHPEILQEPRTLDDLCEFVFSNLKCVVTL